MTTTLLQGDCLEILPTLADKSVDAIITDLPYGTTACKWDVIIPLDEMWKEVKRICKGVFVTTASQPFTSLLIGSNIEEFRHEWIWKKNKGSNFQALRFAPFKEHENIVVFYGGAFNPIKQERTASGLARIKTPMKSERGINPITGLATITKPQEEMRHPSSVQGFTCEMGNHPTQKPVALYEYLIRTYTNPGDTVLDFCAGSGTTGVAAIKTGRNAILIERDPQYFEIMQRRITEAQQINMELA